GRELGQVLHEAGGDQIVGVLAGVELGGTGRIPAHDAADDDRAGCVAGTADGAVDPLVATAETIEGLGEFTHRCGFTARRPPMRNFAIGGLRDGHPAEHGNGGCREQPRYMSHYFLPFEGARVAPDTRSTGRPPSTETM